METQTRDYLRDRFSEYYREVTVTTPPNAAAREWGFVPWTEGPDEEFNRNMSLDTIDDLGAFLAENGPKHVYFSTAQYDTPDAAGRDAKGWQGADLVFYLNADRLESVDSEDTYREKLTTCKDELITLIDALDEFGFDDVQFVFSGDRGYHVHVYDEAYQTLGEREREEIVNYLTANTVDENIVARLGDELNPVTVADRLAMYTGGWQRRFYDAFTEYVDRITDMEQEEALDELTELSMVGEESAAKFYRAATNQPGKATVTVGQFEEITGDTKRVVTAFARDFIDDTGVKIDPPVTTDVHHLVRLPGSIHGGSGLTVRTVPRENLLNFDPLEDAVPDVFRGDEVQVEVTEAGEYEFAGDTFDVSEGEQTLPKPFGVFLMARGDAEKVAT